jgi:hypothetical protein
LKVARALSRVISPSLGCIAPREDSRVLKSRHGF